MWQGQVLVAADCSSGEELCQPGLFRLDDTQELHRLTDRRVSTVAADTTTVWAVVLRPRLGGEIFQSVDGSTWVPQGSRCTRLLPELVGLAAASSLWAVCGAKPGGAIQTKSVLRSDDGGASWHVVARSGRGQALLETGQVAGIAAAGSGLWLVQDRGLLLVSDDDGATWTRSPVADGDVRSVSTIAAIDGGALALVWDGDGQSTILYRIDADGTVVELRRWRI
jgi:hypothetical protein